MSPTTCPRGRVQRGLTLIEACLVLAILAVLTSLAVPSFAALRTRIVLDGAASDLRADLHHARSAAVMRNEAVRVSFYDQGAAGQCRIVHTGERNDCRCDANGNAMCVNGAQALAATHIAADLPVRMQANVPSMRFDPTLGTVSPTGTVCTTAKDGRAVHHVVNLMGRVRSCAPQQGSACRAC
jgi:type IV fimbrial biogenesis protein FimT